MGRHNAAMCAKRRDFGMFIQVWRCDILVYTINCAPVAQLERVRCGRSRLSAGNRIAIKSGPVAQLGARFHGMEEVDGSNPSRSTTTFQTLTALSSTNSVLGGVQLESKPLLMHGQPWAPSGFRCCPLPGHQIQCVGKMEHHGHRFSPLLSAGDDNNCFPYKGCCPVRDEAPAQSISKRSRTRSVRLPFVAFRLGWFVETDIRSRRNSRL